MPTFVVDVIEYSNCRLSGSDIAEGSIYRTMLSEVVDPFTGLPNIGLNV